MTRLLVGLYDALRQSPRSRGERGDSRLRSRRLLHPVVAPNLTKVDRLCDALCDRRVDCRAGWDRKICFRETRPEPADVARRACIAAEAKNHECSGSPEDSDECLDKWGWRVFSDEVLTRLAECEDEPCGRNRRFSCVRTVLGTG